MTLNPGQKLGPYEIISAAGAGGMGEVYKAKDTRLDRIVAIKVLPSKTAQNADLRSRFEREAKAISSLNHPNICTLFDIGHEEGMDYLVMEFLEGETLGEKIKNSSFDFNQALDISIQIADALDKAHRQGLIHRDLKPANVILTKEGAKLLDFGLAKFQVSDGVVEGVTGVTQTTPLTGTGTIIGTIQYMSPEQLEGNEADARSDIFAFGALIYEMISGIRAFKGKSQASLIASILKEEPRSLSEIIPLTPPSLDRLVKKCLAKDPDRRWQSANDLSDELSWIAQSGSQAGIPVTIAAKRKFRFRLGWTVAAVAILAAGFYGFKWHTQPEPIKKIVRFNIEPGKQFQSVTWPQISPDGKYLAFKGTDTTGQSRIWLRPMNSDKVLPLNGTEGALRPFWSPDSRYLAFTVGNSQLKKIPVNGGPAQLIGEFENAADGSWGVNGKIIFDGSMGDSLHIVPSSGGTATAVTKFDTLNNETIHAWPQFLPDGDHFLYLSSIDTSINTGSYMFKIGSISSDEVIEFFKISSKIKYCEPGFLVYVKEKVLFAQPFDANALEIKGEPIPIVENVLKPIGSVIALFDISNEGTLVYLTSNSASKNELVWVDRSGNEISKVGEPDIYGDIALSPDGKNIVYGLLDPQTETMDLWIYDRLRKVSSRFTFEENNDFGPVWSPDGLKIYYGNGIFPKASNYWKLSNGTGNSNKMFDSLASFRLITDISKDGKKMCVTNVDDGSPNIYISYFDNIDSLIPIVKTPNFEYVGKFSPDGKYMVYMAEETDQSELYLRQLTGTGGKWQLSSDGVRNFIWNPDGKEILYFNWDWELISIPININDRLEIGASKKLFKRRLSFFELTINRFAISPDGQQFLLVSPIEQKEDIQFKTILNWPEILKE